MFFSFFNWIINDKKELRKRRNGLRSIPGDGVCVFIYLHSFFFVVVLRHQHRGGKYKQRSAPSPFEQYSELDDDWLVSGCLQKDFKSSNRNASGGLVGHRVKVQIRIFTVLLIPKLPV